MGGRSTNTVAERQTTIQVQQSSYGQPIPVVYGTKRIAGNLVWFANFQANSHSTTSGGKGGGSATNTDYTYTASAILALCEGPIPGIGKVWKDKETSDLTTLNLTLFTGTATQATWSFLTGYSNSTNWAFDTGFGFYNYAVAPSFVSQAINYSSTAYLATSSYDLGNSASVPNHNFEVQGFNIVGGGNPDANPAAVVPDILSNAQYGVGFNSGWVASLSTGAASYSTYCQAVGLFISPDYTQQRPGADCIQELCDATNAAPVWSGGQLKVIPYGDTAVTGNGTTYTPSLTPLFDLGDDDFLADGDADPVLVTRTSPADAYNRISVQFKNRANDYNQEVVYAEDQDAIEKYGLKIASPLTLDFICVSSIAKQVAQLALQRMLYKRNTYEFELGARYAMLEPMDIVTLTDAGLGMSKTPVRIIKIEEQDHSFRITAEDLPIGVAQAATYHHDDGVRWTSATDIPPSNAAAPIIFELPADPSATGLSVGIAAGAQTTDLAYGGCNVWLSLDGTNYKKEGTIWGSSRYGTLSATLAAHAAGMDSTSTMSLALRSNGQITSGSAADVAKGTSLIVCDGEYLAYQTATLTGTRAYNLTTLNRGLYGTTPGSHASGALWVRIDDAIATLTDLNLNMIGQTVYIKLTAFNVYGRAEQALSAVTAYTYTITGNMKALETPIDLGAQNTSGLPFGTNLLVNSEMVLVDPTYGGGTVPLGFQAGWQGNSSNLGSVGFNDRRVALKDGSYAFARDLTGAPNGSAVDCLNSYPLTNLYRYAVPVLPGDNIAASALIGYQNCTGGLVVIGFYDENGAYVDEYGATTVTGSIGASAYNTITRSNLATTSKVITVPADGTGGGTGNRRWAVMWCRFTISGSPTNPRVIVAAPMIAKLKAGQTAIPAYVPGPADRQASYGATTGTNLISPTYGGLADADVKTNLGTALGYINQTAWGTYTGYTPAQVTTPGANLIFNSAFDIGSTGWTTNSWNGPYTSAGDASKFFMACSVNGQGLYTTDVTKINVFANTNYVVQVWGAAGGTSSGTNRPYFHIDWHNSSGGYISSSALAYITPGAGYAVWYVSGTSPPTAAYGRVVMQSGQIATGGGVVYVSKFKFEIGTTPSPWTDEATNSALYQSGQTIDSLKPAQVNADVTLSNTAAGITGQGTWATASNTPFSPGDLLTAMKQNYVYNPTGAYGLDGWTSGGSTAVSANLGNYGEGWYFFAGSGTNVAPAAYYQDHPCQAGVTLSLQAQVFAGGLSGSGANARVYVQWINGSGGHISYSTVAQVAGGSGWTWVSAPGIVSPTGCATARIWMDIWGPGAWTNTSCAWTKIKLEQGSTCTPFTDDATYGARYVSGQSIEALKPAQAGADVTGSNTSNNTNNVSSISAGSVSATINSGGGVANNQVVTASIQAAQVTTLSSAFTNTGTTATIGAWVDVQTVTISASGAPIIIQTSCETDTAFGASMQFDITEDGTEIFFMGPINVSAPGLGQSFSFIETPSAGSHTYKLRAYCFSASFAPAVTKAFLSILELKR